MSLVAALVLLAVLTVLILLVLRLVLRFVLITVVHDHVPFSCPRLIFDCFQKLTKAALPFADAAYRCLPASGQPYAALFPR